jgi:Outer membrane protein beta-barrel domain
MPGGSVPIFKRLLVASAVFISLEGSAAAQAMFTGSLGNVFGGNAPSKKNAWAVAIGGNGAHGIGSELEYSETRQFFETPDGLAYGKVITLMPSIFVTIPFGRLQPYGIFGFGFIRQRVETNAGGLFSNLSDDDIGYSIGGGVTYKFARSAGIRGDLRHFKVRTSDGISFQRITVGIVFGG